MRKKTVAEAVNTSVSGMSGMPEFKPRLVQEPVRENDPRRFMMGFGPVVLKGAIRWQPPPPMKIEIPARLMYQAGKGKKKRAPLTVEQLMEQQSLMLAQIVAMANEQAKYYHELLGSRDLYASGELVTREGQGLPSPQTVIFAMQPQLPFRAEGVMFCGDHLDRIWVHDIKVGKNSMLLSSNSVPAQCVDKLRHIDIDTCNVGQQMTVSVSNFAEKDLLFGGMFYGTALQ